jgi:hypothetical protein
VPKRLPRDVIASWPEVFGKIEINAIPSEYLQSIIVSFINGEQWEIDMDSKEMALADITVEEILSDLLEEYEDEIESVDFRVHTERVKRDMIKTTRKFMKGKFRKK